MGGCASEFSAATGGRRRGLLTGERVESTEALRFVGGDLGFVLLDVADFIDAGEEAVFGEGVDGEVDCRAAGPGEDLGFDVYGNLQAGVGYEGVAELLVDIAADDEGEEAVFEGVLFEDISETRRDDRFKSVLGEGPRGVFAG